MELFFNFGDDAGNRGRWEQQRQSQNSQNRYENITIKYKQDK